MNIFNRLSTDDKDMINFYLDTYTGGKISNRASIEHILRIWDKDKADLYTLLGKELIVSKEIEYLENASAIADRLKTDMHNNKIANDVRYTFINWLHSNDIPQEIKFWSYELTNMLEPYALADNKARFVAKIEIESTGTTISIQHNTKPMKILAKLNKEFHIVSNENFEQFRIVHSQSLNQKKLKGELVLSIHPLDFMTMSDNSSGWSSCMSWQRYGCYRRGTVEMMNSPVVVVAYLKGAEDMYMCLNSDNKELVWNNKKWRQLFIINEELIASVKSYPYFNEFLTVEVIKWLNELAKKNWNISYNIDKLYGYEDRNDPEFYFECNSMYNDFGSTDHFIAVSDESRTNYFVNYSGATECMHCGSINNWFPDEDEAMSLLCEECDTSYCCEDCGYRTYEKSINYLDGMGLCDDCFANRARQELFTRNTHDRYAMTEIYLLPEEYRERSLDDKITYLRSKADVMYICEDTIDYNYDEYFKTEDAIFRVEEKSDIKNPFYLYSSWKCFYLSDVKEEYKSRVTDYDAYEVWD